MEAPPGPNVYYAGLAASRRLRFLLVRLFGVTKIHGRIGAPLQLSGVNFLLTHRARCQPRNNSHGKQQRSRDAAARAHAKASVANASPRSSEMHSER